MRAGGIALLLVVPFAAFGTVAFFAVRAQRCAGDPESSAGGDGVA